MRSSGMPPRKRAGHSRRGDGKSLRRQREDKWIGSHSFQLGADRGRTICLVVHVHRGGGHGATTTSGDCHMILGDQYGLRGSKQGGSLLTAVIVWRAPRTCERQHAAGATSAM